MIWKKHKDKIVFLLFLIQFILIYKLIQEIVTQGRLLTIPIIDNFIPLIPIFVIPYLLFFPFILLPIAMVWKDKKRLFQIAITYLFASTIANLIFLIFQTTVIRPELFPSTIANRWIIYIYSFDKPLNLFPSTHVTFTALANLCLLKINKKIAYGVLPLTILIILSTMFIKQHYIPDLFAGLLLAWLSYEFIYKRTFSQTGR